MSTTKLAMTPEQPNPRENIELDDIGLMVDAVNRKYGQVIPVMAMIELCVGIRRMLDAAVAEDRERCAKIAETHLLSQLGEPCVIIGTQ